MNDGIGAKPFNQAKFGFVLKSAAHCGERAFGVGGGGGGGDGGGDGDGGCGDGGCGDGGGGGGGG